ncbi:MULTISPECIES: TonB-dependent receptor [unclassified Iodidimonas]|jgi:outer membrane receptor protein involved in Fe transport|uniref:TonB-dependent receptor domain-containing protein n=1 Tax=unclassified Iodidimonas TaxID=2626145 RepID=UPI002482A2E8|nr:MULTISPECIES: TonB-dependent receptor [unclassified Iodidimonas]
MHPQDLKKGRRLSLLAASSIGILAMTTSAVWSQESATEEDESALEVEEIVVTGSRIRRPDLTAVSPIISLDAADLQNRSFTNIADALNELPAFGAPGASPAGAQNGFAVGQNFVNFFGLGSQRTLTLVNGRRFVSSNVPSVFGAAGGLQVDFNVIPIAMVERIETIPVRGAPIYGSDAIAGTVNVILKDDYEGFSLSGQYGLTTDKGDGETWQVQGVWGGNFADGRGNVVTSIEFNRQDGIAGGTRKFFSDNEAFFGEQANFADADGDGQLDDVNTIFRDQMVQIVTLGGIVSPGPTVVPTLGLGAFGGEFLQFENGTGNIVPFTPGTRPPGSVFFAAGGDGVDLFDLTDQIQSPLDRIVGSSIASYKLTDNITAYSEMLFANTNSVELGNQAGFQTFAFSGDSGALRFNSDHPFLNAQARGELNRVGADEFYVSRFNFDFLDGGRNYLESSLWRVVAGFKGDFNLGERKFNWDASSVFGESDIDTRSTSIIDQNFVNSLDAIQVTESDLQSLIDAGAATDRAGAIAALEALSGTPSAGVGDIICRNVLEFARGDIDPPISGNGLVDTDLPGIEGCAPSNLFGAGQMSPEAVAFVTGNNVTSSDIKQRIFNVNLSGDLIELPGGWAGFNFGYENRQESADFNPGFLAASNLNRASPSNRTQGTFTTNEIFLEGFIPIISPDMNIPFLQNFSFEGAARVVDNSIAGTDTTYTFGGQLGFTEDLTVRGNFTQAIRAPSLTELLTPDTLSFSFANDPCDSRFVNEGPSPDIRRRNCEAVGLSQDFTSDIVNASRQGINAGNPNLQNEVAESWTLGAIITPRWVPGFSLTLDYVNISIDDRIASLTLTQILQSCFDSADFPNVGTCDQFERAPDGQIIDFRSGFNNAATSEFQAVVFDANYRFDVAEALGMISESWGSGDKGNLRFRVNGIRRYQNDFSVVGEEPVEVIGGFNNPKWSATFDTTYNYGPFQAFWRVAYQDATLLDPQGDNFFQDESGRFVSKTGSRFINNVTLSYNFLENYTAQVTVDNILDRNVTAIEQADGAFGFEELLGRFITFSFSARF